MVEHMRIPVLVLVVGTGVAMMVHWSPAVEGGATLNMTHQTSPTCRGRARIVKHGFKWRWIDTVKFLVEMNRELKLAVYEMKNTKQIL